MITVGTQGWNYDAWVGSFYPPKTRSGDFLSLYARMFDSVEVDATFYAPPSRSTVDQWLERTPPEFTFSLKLVRSITHECRLRDVGADLATFCERARRFGPRLGVILVQMPPDFSPRERSAFSDFLGYLPRDLRFAVEFRDGDWLTTATLDLLASHGVALALVDGEWLPRDRMRALAAQPTADFVYARWMGSRAITDHSHVQVDRETELRAWAEVLEAADRQAGQVFAYFSNFFEGHAPASANRFKIFVKQHPEDPDSLVSQPSLF